MSTIAPREPTIQDYRDFVQANPALVTNFGAFMAQREFEPSTIATLEAQLEAGYKTLRIGFDTKREELLKIAAANYDTVSPLIEQITEGKRIRSDAYCSSEEDYARKRGADELVIQYILGVACGSTLQALAEEQPGSSLVDMINGDASYVEIHKHASELTEAGNYGAVLLAIEHARELWQRRGDGRA